MKQQIRNALRKFLTIWEVSFFLALTVMTMDGLFRKGNTLDEIVSYDWVGDVSMVAFAISVVIICISLATRRLQRADAA